MSEAIIKGNAIEALRPNAEWSLVDSTIIWHDNIQTQPTEERSTR